MMTTPQEPPQGLLSFIYNAIFVQSVHEAVLQDIKSVMDEFGLTDEEQAAVLNSQDEGQPTKADAQAIGALLQKEVEENFDTFYGEFW